MNSFEHNTSQVVIPSGFERYQIKRLILEQGYLNGDCRFLLSYVLDQSATYIFTVRGIRERLQWGEHRWVATRKKLESMRILTQRKHVLPDKSSRWELNFDFTSLVQTASARVTPDPKAS